MSTTQNVTGTVTLLIGNQGGGTSSMLLVNLDSTNTVWVNESSQVQYGGPVGIPLQPGASISMVATQGLWAVSGGPTVQVAMIPNGNSYFFPASLTNLGGAKVYVQGTAPAGIIPPNSIWFDTSNDSLQTWNGTHWVVQQFSGQELILPATLLGSQLANGTLTSAQLAAAAGILGTQIASATITGGNIAANTIVADNIAANTITAAELAANIVYAGIVNGTTITGAQLVATGTSGDFLAYSGTPAHGNLIASISPVAGEDDDTNPYFAGISAYQPNTGTYVSMQPLSPAALTIGTGDTAQNTPGYVTSGIVGSGTGRLLGTALFSPTIAGYEDISSLNLYSVPVGETYGSYAQIGSEAVEGCYLQLGSNTGSVNYSLFNVVGYWNGASTVLLGLQEDTMLVGAPLSATEPGAPGTEEIWHTVTPTGSWTVNSPLQYKLYPDNTVAIRGELTSTAAIAYGATLMTLPTGYHPATASRNPINYNTGSTSITPALMTVSTAGVVQTYEAIATGNTLNFNIRFALD